MCGPLGPNAGRTWGRGKKGTPPRAVRLDRGRPTTRSGPRCAPPGPSALRPSQERLRRSGTGRPPPRVRDGLRLPWASSAPPPATPRPLPAPLTAHLRPGPEPVEAPRGKEPQGLRDAGAPARSASDPCSGLGPQRRSAPGIARVVRGGQRPCAPSPRTCRSHPWSRASTTRPHASRVGPLGDLEAVGAGLRRGGWAVAQALRAGAGRRGRGPGPGRGGDESVAGEARDPGGEGAPRRGTGGD